MESLKGLIGTYSSSTTSNEDVMNLSQPFEVLEDPEEVEHPANISEEFQPGEDLSILPVPNLAGNHPGDEETTNPTTSGKIVNLSECRFEDQNSLSSSGLFRDPDPWKVTTLHIKDYLACLSPFSATGISALSMTILAIGELSRQPDAAKIFPRIPWKTFRRVRDLLGHKGKFDSKIAFHNHGELLEFLREDVWAIKNIFDHCYHENLRASLNADWLGIHGLLKVLEGRDRVENGKETAKPGCLKISAANYVSNQVEVGKHIVASCFQENGRVALMSVLLNRADNAVRATQAALSFTFVNVSTLLSENNLLLSSIVPEDEFRKARNALAHLSGHVSTTPGLAETVYKFFLYVVKEEKTLCSALEYCAAFSAKNEKAEELMVLGKIIRSDVALSEEEVKQMVCSAFPEVAFNRRGFDHFLKSLSELDWFVLARKSHWGKMLKLLRIHNEWKDVMEERESLTLFHLAANAWVGNDSKKALLFCVEGFRNASLKTKMDPQFQDTLARILQPLKSEKLYATLDTFCSYRPKPWVPRQYVEFIGRFAPDKIDSIVHEKNRQTFLHIAAQKQFLELVRFLIEVKGADPNILCKNGKSAFCYLREGDLIKRILGHAGPLPKI